MGIYHKPLKTKTTGTGARKKQNRNPILAHYGNPPLYTKIADKEVRIKHRGRGKNTKIKLKKATYINLRDKNGKIKRVKIKKVLEAKDNRHFVRQNILTKGCIIETELGKARITNRVGQDGVVNGVLVE